MAAQSAHLMGDTSLSGFLLGCAGKPERASFARFERVPHRQNMVKILPLRSDGVDHGWRGWGFFVWLGEGVGLTEGKGLGDGVGEGVGVTVGEDVGDAVALGVGPTLAPFGVPQSRCWFKQSATKALSLS